MSTAQRVDYDKQATDFLTRFQFTLKVTPAGAQTPPPWAEKGKEHGVRYSVTLQRAEHRAPSPQSDDGNALRFPFWDSIRNRDTGKRPTAYDVLACIASDSTSPTSADGVYEEFGDMKPSVADRIAKHSKRIQDFFWKNEIAELQEIQ